MASASSMPLCAAVGDLRNAVHPALRRYDNALREVLAAVHAGRYASSPGAGRKSSLRRPKFFIFS
jgi:hypothetical protein